MNKKEELFFLIKSLSPSEKRYFTMFANRIAKGSNYVRLFEVIEAQDIYDEKAIKSTFKGEKFIRQLHVTKSYLRTMILKSLRNYHDELSKDAEVKDLLRNVEILFNKELYVHAQTELDRAYSLAMKFELNMNLVEILNWQQKMSQTRSPHDYHSFRQILSRQEASIKKVENINRYTQLIVDVSQAIVEGRDEVTPHENLLD